MQKPWKMMLLITTPGAPIQLSVNVVIPDIPLLLGLDILTEHGLNVMLATDEVKSATTMPIHRQHWHIALAWENLSATWRTRNQLLRLHKRIAHSSTHKVLNLLRRADHDGPPPGTKWVLKEIALACHLLSTY
jgi:hypothetical protein